MNAEIIAVGSELLTPDRIDTNSLYLTERLNALGVEVILKSIVGDDRRRLADCVRAAMDRSGIVVLTGGLGPTEDDVTRDAVALALGRGLEFRQELLEAIQARFQRINRPMAEINRRQAFLVEGAEAMPNPHGTAPGQWVPLPAGAILILPGPPGEMKPMFEDHCVPRLRGLLPPLAIRTRFYRVAGMGESDLDQLIAPVYTKYSNPVTTILAAPGDIQIHLRARCHTEAEAERLLEEVGGAILPLLGERVYSTAGEPLEAVVGAMLRQRRATLALAESCTGGLVAERLTTVAGSSEWFLGGVVSYTDGVKTKLLGVSPELLAEYTAVSRPAAAAMAEGARLQTGADFALSVTGFAGPDGGTGSDPVGTVYIGLASPGSDTSVVRFRFGGERHRVRALAAQTALDLLRRRLQPISALNSSLKVP